MRSALERAHSLDRVEVNQVLPRFQSQGASALAERMSEQAKLFLPPSAIQSFGCHHSAPGFRNESYYPAQDNLHAQPASMR